MEPTSPTTKRKHLVCGTRDLACTCSQDDLKSAVDISIQKCLDPPDAPLIHYNGYVVPARCEMNRLVLAEQYTHPRDDEIVFDDKQHLYFIRGKRVDTSVTTLLHQFCSHFDADTIIQTMVNRKDFPNQ